MLQRPTKRLYICPHTPSEALISFLWLARQHERHNSACCGPVESLYWARSISDIAIESRDICQAWSQSIGLPNESRIRSIKIRRVDGTHTARIVQWNSYCVFPNRSHLPSLNCLHNLVKHRLDAQSGRATSSLTTVCSPLLIDVYTNRRPPTNRRRTFVGVGQSGHYIYTLRISV